MSDPILGQILNQLQQMDKRFDSIDGHLGKINHRLGCYGREARCRREQTRHCR